MEFDPREEWDPLHTYTAPDVYWSRANTGEALPGVQTPLSWTFWNRGTELALREATFMVGALTRAERPVPKRIEDRWLRIFMGRTAARVDLLTTMGDRMPGTTGEETARAVFGSVPEGMELHPTRRRYPIVAWRLPLAFAVIPGRCRRLSAETDAWYRSNLGRVDAIDLGAARALFAEADRRFGPLVVLQTAALFAVIQPLYEAVTKVIERTGVGDVSTLSGTGGAEMAVVTDIWRAASGEIALEEVTARHGFHGPLEGELSSPVWREDDAPLSAMLPLYAERPDPRRTDAARELAAMQREILAALPGVQRPPVRLLLSLAASRILLRGVIKRSFLQCFDIARASARRMGELLAADGRIADPADVFFLTFGEVTGTLPADSQDLIARRRARHAEYAQFELPDVWRGAPQPVSALEGERPDHITGTGVSGGVVEATAYVIEDPAAPELEPDGVLVARTTDPSWSSIMFLSAALVVDIGGAMSHAAVVARELGIPCVVGTGSGTRVLRTGDRLRVDGDAGLVEIV